MLIKDKSIQLKRRYRLLNLVIDSFGVYFLFWGVGSIVIFFFEKVIGLDFYNVSRGIYEKGNLGIIYNTILISSFVASIFLYYLVLEYYFQKTWGKVVTRSKVVTINGNKATCKQILIRTSCRFIPIEWISFIYSKNTLHDELSNTKVVSE
jgi:uncharacterized RDD family membrane protein YckC